MKIYSDYIIIPDKKLIVEYYRGNISAYDVIALKERQLTNPDYNANYNIIDYFIDVKFELDPQIVQKYVDYVLKERKNYGERSTVFITSEPNQVAMTTLFGDMKKSLPINAKVVSTLELALEFLGFKPNDQPIIEVWINRQRADRFIVK